MSLTNMEIIQEFIQNIKTNSFSVNGTSISIGALLIGLLIDLLFSFFTFIFDKTKDQGAKMQSVFFKGLWRLIMFAIFSTKYHLFNKRYHYSTRTVNGKFDLVHFRYRIFNIPDLFVLVNNKQGPQCNISRLEDLINKRFIAKEESAINSLNRNFAIARNELNNTLKRYFAPDKTNEIIKYAENQATNLFVDGERVFYNNLNYGFVKFKKIKNDFKIHISEQDYYSFKFRTETHNLIKATKPELFSSDNIYSFKKESGISLVDINQLDKVSPFLGLIGLGGFVIVNRGYGDELLFVKRSSNLHVGGFWHYSVDETFDLNDRNNSKKRPDIETCLIRALHEELGFSIQESRKHEILSNIRYFGTGIINTDIKELNDERIEVQVLFGLRIELNNRFSWRDFRYKQLRARDKEQEVSTIQLVKIKDLDTFLNRGNHFSPESLYLAKAIRIASQFNQI